VTRRRAAAAAAAALLLVLMLRRDRPSELGLRARTLVRSAQLDLDTLHMHGTAAAFDRQFYPFLESARRKLPPGAPGVAIFGMAPSDGALYFATYHLAPTPVLLAPKRIPPGWILAVYETGTGTGTGTDRPPGWKVIAPVWKGVLMAPSS
jgi:hypothetical protein